MTDETRADQRADLGFASALDDLDSWPVEPQRTAPPAPVRQEARATAERLGFPSRQAGQGGQVPEPAAAPATSLGPGPLLRIIFFRRLHARRKMLAFENPIRRLAMPHQRVPCHLHSVCFPEFYQGIGSFKGVSLFSRTWM